MPGGVLQSTNKYTRAHQSIYREEEMNENI
jgi:hypothetical protein